MAGYYNGMQYVAGSYGARQVEATGPAINNYQTQQQSLAQGTNGGLEFRDCQNPDAADGYIVGPNEKVSTSTHS